MPKVFQSTNPNLWLGTPRTAFNVPPLTAGADVGDVETGTFLRALSNRQMRLWGGQITNAATASAAGYVALLPDQMNVVGTWTHATTTFADQSAATFTTGADLITIFTTTNNDGFIVGSLVPINVIGLEVTTTGGTAGTMDYAYWGQPTTGIVGSAAWQTVSTNLLSTLAANAAGEKLLVLNVPPRLMTATTASSFTGTIAGYYYLRVRATTAPTGTVTKSSHIYAGVEIARGAQVAQYGQVTLAGGVGGSSRTVSPCAAVGAYFGTANASNHLYLEYD